jgi:hypothetical protein
MFGYIVKYWSLPWWVMSDVKGRCGSEVEIKVLMNVVGAGYIERP